METTARLPQLLSRSICYESSKMIRGRGILIFTAQQVDVTENRIIRAKEGDR